MSNSILSIKPGTAGGDAPSAVPADYGRAADARFGPRSSQEGSTFSIAQGEAFSRMPHSLTAVRLRRYNDLAKVPGDEVPDLDHYRAPTELVAL